MASIKKFTQITLASSLIFLAACNEKNHAGKTDEPTPIPVVLAAPDAGNQEFISASGIVESSETVNISTRIMGYISRIYVKVGEHVGMGQLLATIKSEDIQAKKAQADAAIAEADANFKSAEKDYERFNALFQKQSASAKELDNVTLQFKAAKARLDAARQMRNEVDAMSTYTNLVSPFDGIVTQKMVDEGAMAGPGTTLVTIEHAGKLQIRASVSENDIRKIKPGGKAKVEIGAAGRTIESKIIELSPSSQLTGGQFLIRLNVPATEDKNLNSGMYVNVTIPIEGKDVATGESKRIRVSTSSLVHQDQLTGLYTVSSRNTAMLRWVRIGKSGDNTTEILSGLAVGDKYIAKAGSPLYNGAPVTVANN